MYDRRGIRGITSDTRKVWDHLGYDWALGFRRIVTTQQSHLLGTGNPRRFVTFYKIARNYTAAEAHKLAKHYEAQDLNSHTIHVAVVCSSPPASFLAKLAGRKEVPMPIYMHTRNYNNTVTIL